MGSNNLNKEKELLLRVAEGDENAFQQLVHTYSNKVFFHAMTFVKTWHGAEEIAQDIFLHIWQKRHKLSEIDNLDNYIFIVSKNYLISFMRKKLRNWEHAELDAVAEFMQASSAQYENKELGILIEKAIDQLPDQKKQVFRMIHQDGLSQEEVSQKLGIAPRTVRWNLVSATNGIKDFLFRYSSGDFYLLLPFILNYFQNK